MDLGVQVGYEHAVPKALADVAGRRCVFLDARG
jgi:hypothetical protein